MTDFAPHLRALSTGLMVPEPNRSRILLEVASDMEDLLEHYLAKGMDRDQAVATVQEHFDLSEEALRELTRVHASPFQQSLEGISGQARKGWERAVLLLVGLFVLPGLVFPLAKPAVLVDAGPLAWGLIPTLAVALVLGVREGAGLSGKNALRGGRIPRLGIRTLPAFSLLLLGLGFAGAWLEFYRAALRVREAPQQALVHLIHWLHLASATLVVALSGALLTALFWFFLEARATHLEERAAARLLEAP